MTRAAAIDVGTNTVRLLIADVLPPDAPIHLDRGLEITRLGRGVDAEGHLSDDAIRRTLDAVAGFAERAATACVDTIRVAGTSALRDAADGGRFVEAVRDATGLEVELLEGSSEGRLAFLGATWELADGPHVVCDVGGGSTELVRGGRDGVSVVSVDVGSVRVRERYLASDPPTDDEVERARAFVRERLAEADRIGITGAETFVGVAGTVTTLAALVLGLRTYDPERVHGARIPSTEVRRWLDRLRGMPTDEIGRLPTMEPGRADVITSGSLVLLEVLDRWGFDEVAVSERDLLDGLILDAVGASR